MVVETRGSSRVEIYIRRWKTAQQVTNVISDTRSTFVGRRECVSDYIIDVRDSLPFFRNFSSAKHFCKIFAYFIDARVRGDLNYLRDSADQCVQ